MALLDEQLSELSAHASDAAICVPSLSKWSIGQHIEHTLIAISGMILALKKEHPGTGTGSRAPNEYRDLVMSTKSFPRGVVEAPDISRPSDSPSQQFLERLILKTRNRVGSPLDISPKSTLIHPIMDVMMRDEAIEFMTIHTAHHLVIIREISEAARS